MNSKNVFPSPEEIPNQCWPLLEYLEERIHHGPIKESNLPKALKLKYSDELDNEFIKIYRLYPVPFDPLPLPLRDTIIYCVQKELIERPSIETKVQMGKMISPALRLAPPGFALLALRRLRQREPSSTAPLPSPKPPKKNIKDQVKKMDLALAVLAQHPEWSDTRIAIEVGCNRTSLYRWNKFMIVREIIKSNKNKYPQGSKDGKTGAIEAWDYSDT